MKYYFYTLNEVRYPEDKDLQEVIDTEGELLDKCSKTKDRRLKSMYMYGVAFSHELRNSRRKNSEEFQFQNGQDARYFIRYGVKEIDEESYNRIVEDDVRIVKSFNQKTLGLMDKFNHRKDGWHFPFYVEAESKSHLRWKLKEIHPDYGVEFKES